MYKADLYFLICFLLSINGIAQQFSKKQIDSLQENITSSLIKKGQLQEALLLNIKTIEYAKSIKYDKGVNVGHVKVSSLLCTFGEHLESLRYLDLVNEKVSQEKETDLKINIYAN